MAEEEDVKEEEMTGDEEVDTWSWMGMGTYWPCFNSSVSLTPLGRRVKNRRKTRKR